MTKFNTTLLTATLGAALTVAMTPAIQAATITQDESQGGAEPLGWNKTSIWSPNGAPTAGNDYVNPVSFVVRTPEANNSIFAGDSLTIKGTLALKSGNDNSYTKTVNDLRLDGATISNFTSGAGRTQTLNGNITVLSDSIVNTGNASQDRHFIFGAKISGSAILTLDSYNSNSRTAITNASNDFTGTWSVAAGVARFTDAGTVGAGDVLVTGGNLEIQHNWTSPTASLDVQGGKIALSTYNWTIAGLTIGTNVLTANTYSVAQLNSYGTPGVTFTGSGTITVNAIPEPMSLALLATGGLLMLPGRRR